MRSLSREDIFVYKLIGNRDHDIERIADLVTSDLDFHIITDELETQSALNDGILTRVNDALAKLTEAHGRTTPIDEWVRTRLVHSSESP